MRRRIGPGSRRSATSEMKHLSMNSIRPWGDMIGYGGRSRSIG